MSNTPATCTARLILRLGLGTVLVAHGSQKLFGAFGGGGLRGTAAFFESGGFRPGRQHALASGLAEAGGGAALVLGLATPAAGAAVAGNMVVAASTHRKGGFFGTNGGWEYPAFLGLSAVTLVIGGPGCVSLDQATGNVLNRPWMRVAALAAVPIGVGVVLARRNAAVAEDARSASATASSVTSTSAPSSPAHRAEDSPSSDTE